MAKYIKPPYLSTHLSQSGRQAKKRFDNILNGSAKRTSVIALALVIAAAAAVGCIFTFKPNKEYSLTEKRITEIALRKNISQLIYASDERAIIDTVDAIIVYNLEKGRIDKSIDLEKAGLLGSMNGLVKASKDGNSVYIGNTDFTYTKYDIENDEFTYSVNEYDFFDEYEGIGVKINENKYCFLLNPYTDITAGLRIFVNDNGKISEFKPFSNSHIENMAKKLYSEPPDNGSFVKVQFTYPDIYRTAYVPISDYEQINLYFDQSMYTPEEYGLDAVKIYENIDELNNELNKDNYTENVEDNVPVPRMLIDILKDKVGFEVVAPRDISDVISAEMNFSTKDEEPIVETLNDSAKLDEITEILSAASPHYGGGCPYNGNLTLMLANGKEEHIHLASDGCNLAIFGSAAYYSISKESMNRIWEMFPEANIRKNNP